MRRWRGSLVAAWFAAALPAASLAQDADGTLPVLIDKAPAAYPHRALQLALEADVLLSIEVSDTGEVLGVEVIEPAGHGFDEAAESAARSFRFEPARDAKGRAVSSSIQYRFPFRMELAPPLSIDGVVKEKGARKLLAGATITAAGPDGIVVHGRSDSAGAFRFAGLSPGEWVLTVEGNGIVPSSASVVVPEGDYVEGVTLYAVRRDEFDYSGYDDYIEVIHHVGRAEVIERGLERDLVVTLPGSLGDPVRAVQNLPGVGRAPFGSGQLLVRGTDPEDTSYNLDGLRIPIALHFSGLSTVVNADMLDEILFLPGSWSTRYGRSIGGVVDLKTDLNLPRRGRSYASADVFQATAFTEQRLGARTGMVLSVRRSYLDTILNPILKGAGAGAVRTPRYYDAQVHLFRRVAHNGTLDVLFFMSDDRFRVLGDEDTTGDAVVYSANFSKLRASWLQPIGNGWANETRFMVGPENRTLELAQPGDGVASDFGVTEALVADLPPDGDAAERAVTYGLRQEFLRSPGDDLFGGRIGADLAWGSYDVDYDFGSDLHEITGVFTPALYAEPIVGAGPVTLSAGLRWEGLNVGGFFRNAVDPRGTLALDLGSTRISVGGGQYSQPPQLRELVDEDSGLSLSHERAWHLGVGWQQDVGQDLEVQVAAYSHLLLDLVVGREGTFRFDQTTIREADDTAEFANDGVGRSYGVETLVRYITEDTTAWLALSLGRSQRIDRPGDDIEPAEFEQPVQVTAIASQAIGRGWRLGARGRVASGPPVTPVQNRVFLADASQWAPVYGRPWSERSASFFSLDVRSDKEWILRSWRLAWYLELQNLTNHRNVEIPAYSRDFSKYEPVYGLPIIPAFGLRGEW